LRIVRTVPTDALIDKGVPCADMKKLLIAILVVVVLAVGALVVVNLAFRQTSVTTRAVRATVREIVVRSDSGDVSLVPARTRIQVRDTRRYVVKKPKLTLAVKDGVLRVDTACDRLLFKCVADLRIAVPAGVRIRVVADSGDIDARELEARSAHLQSDAGEIRLGLVGHQSLVWAHTDFGRVEVLAPDARAVDAQSDSGDVAVDIYDRVPRRIVARSDSGFVQVLVPKAVYAIKAKTNSGSRKVGGLRRSARAPSSIEATSDSGDVIVRPR
jgi:DUF4097 and DUF4098 domain-containing protein YvlB